MIEKEWVTKAGMKAQCIFVRGSHRCGYVQVNGVLEGMHYSDDLCSDLDVHGGLTYSGCITDDDTWWLGFDCAHLGDVTLGLNLGMDGGVHRDMNFVIRNCEKLAEQLKGLK